MNKREIVTAAPVIAINQDKVALAGGLLVNRKEEADVGMYWVMFSDDSEEFVSEREYLLRGF